MQAYNTVHTGPNNQLYIHSSNNDPFERWADWWCPFWLFELLVPESIYLCIRSFTLYKIYQFLISFRAVKLEMTLCTRGTPIDKA